MLLNAIVNSNACEGDEEERNVVDFVSYVINLIIVWLLLLLCIIVYCCFYIIGRKWN